VLRNMCREEISNSQHTQATTVSFAPNTINCSLINMNKNIPSNENDPECGDQRTSQTLIIGRFRVSSVNEPVEILSHERIQCENNLSITSETKEVIRRKEINPN